MDLQKALKEADCVEAQDLIAMVAPPRTSLLLAKAMQRACRKDIQRIFQPSPDLERLRGFARLPDCDCRACRALVSVQGAQSAPRTIQQAAAQEAAKPQSERKAAKRRPRSIADEWLDRR